MTTAVTNGGPFDCYPPGWPHYPTTAPAERTGWPRETSAMPHTRPLSIQEQMGTDPISKLAAAIEKLADAIKGEGMEP